MNGRQSALKFAWIVGAATTVFIGTTAWAQAPTHLNIPAQPLESALNQLAQQTGVNIVFESRLVAGLKAAKLDATLTAEEAVRTLVGATGLKVVSNGAGGFVLLEPSQSPAPPRRASMISQPAAPSEPVSAPPSTQNASEKLEEIIVTARKRSENALTIPTAITALSALDLAQRGLGSILDIATYTPSVTDVQAQAGLQHADRAFQTLIIRGMNPVSPLTPNTSLFINGTEVASADMLSSLSSDVDHVEILKGPQTAYFGRATFAGAINVVTKSATDSWKGDFATEAGTRNTFGLNGNVSGPIIPYKLMIAFGGDWGKHDGSYTNANDPNQTLGDQETQSFHFAFTATPIDNLTVKAYTLWTQDNDGPGALGIYQATAPKFNQSNCLVAGTPFLCGTLPGLLYNITPAQNSTVTPAISAFLANPGGIIDPSQVVKGFGLKREADHTDLTVQYVIPDINLTITNLAAYNQNKFSNLYDLSNLDTTASGPYLGHFPILLPGTAGGFPYFIEVTHENASEEFRIATDASKPFRALIGYSYIHSYDVNASGAAIGSGSVNGTANPGTSETQGIFFSLTYDILPQLTIDFDGRYQTDHEYSYTNDYVQTDQISSDNFLPRASLIYTFAPNMMTYLTYSKGANPAAINSYYVNLPEVSKAAIAASGTVALAAVPPELITNYEAGVKGRFFEGRATIAADIYYDDWTRQINNGTYYFAGNDPANPFNVMGNSPGQPDPVGFFSDSSSSVAKGVEFEGNLIPVDHVTLNLSAAYNDTQYTKFICTSCVPYTSFDAKGKYLPNAPLFSTTIGAMYANTIHAFAWPMDWFFRVDVIYRDGVWINSANTAKTPSTEIVNLRGGFALGKGWSIEGFVNNLNDCKSPVSGYATSDPFSAVSVALPQLITGGVKVRYRF
jgi:iron complex outermembrane recepter protein